MRSCLVLVLGVLYFGASRIANADTSRDVERTIALLEKAASIVDDDCDKTAVSIGKFNAANQSTLHALREAIAIAERKAAKARHEKPYDARTGPAGEKFFFAMRCPTFLDDFSAGCNAFDRSDVRTDVEKQVALTEKLGIAIDGNKDDCAKLSISVNNVCMENDSALAHREILAQERLLDGFRKCLGNKKTTNAFAGLLPDVDQGLALGEQFAALIDSNKGDCRAMAVALTGFVDESGKRFKQIKSSLSDKKNKNNPKKYENRLNVAEKKLREGLQACKGDGSVVAALQRFDAL